MADKRDYYDVLGISKNADKAEVEKAYRRLAMKYHPDRNAGDTKAEEKFKQVKEAHGVLSDEQKRAAYDQFGHATNNASFSQGGFGDIFNDIFNDVFDAGGKQGRSGHAGQGADLRYNLQLSLEEAATGITTEIHVPKTVPCNTCGGSGAKKGSSPINCPHCNGHGQIRIQQGFFSVQQTCPQCRGQGKIISEPCGQCRGQGRVRNGKTISVKIPAGVDNGDRVRLTGEGDAGERNGPPGDLYVFITVKAHPVFVREGTHLYCDVPISFATAALGGELEVPTLGGRVKLKIPPETQSGKQFRLKSKGVHSVRSTGKGDLICRVVVETPVKLNKRQKELLRELNESIHTNSVRHNPQEDSWLDKVKKFF